MEEFIEIKFYKVKCGDCIYIRYVSGSKIFNIFVDAGYSDTYKKTLRQEVKSILGGNEKIDLFIITHIDQDHISGIKPFLKEFGIDIIKDFWFNHADKLTIPNGAYENEISVKQGVLLRKYLKNNNVEEKEIFFGQNYNISKEFNLKILSPTNDGLNKFKNEWQEEEKEFEFEISSSTNDYGSSIEYLAKNDFDEDKDITNSSSIAFLLQMGNIKLLFSADAIPSILLKSLKNLGYSNINRLKLNLLKVPHHGSKRNLSTKLLEVIDCQHFVFSANGVNRDNLPHKETIARIITNPLRNFKEKIYLYFNYDNETLRSICTEYEQKKYNFECIYAKNDSNNLKFTFENGLFNFE